MVIALWQCVMLTSSPAGVTLTLLHFLFISFFSLSMSCILGIWLQHNAQLLAKPLSIFHSVFLISLKNQCTFERSWIFFPVHRRVWLCLYQMWFASCFCWVSGNISAGWHIWISYSFWRDVSFLLLQQMLCWGGLKASSGLGHLSSAEFHLLCWREGRGESPYGSCRLDTRANPKNTHAQLPIFCTTLSRQEEC